MNKVVLPKRHEILKAEQEEEINEANKNNQKRKVAKTRYSDPELLEFKELIEKKLEEAKVDLQLLKGSLSHNDDHGTNDTGRTFNMMEDGSDTLSREEVAQLAARQEKFIQTGFKYKGDLDRGIKETIDDKVNGFLCGEGCIDEFAENVILLSKNRETLMNMKQNAFNTITKYFDPFTNFKFYHQLFIELINDGKIPVHHSVNQKIGSRLDSKYIPNWITLLFR